MFILRSGSKQDLKGLFELSHLMSLINLPKSRIKIQKKIETSIRSFKNPSKDLEKNHYLFILEDSTKKKIIGTSTISGKHGTPKKPHSCLKVKNERKISKALNKRLNYKKLTLKIHTNGWTEIGGLVLNAKYRGHAYKLGKALSFVRFLHIGLNRKNFTNIIHTELMPASDKKNTYPLWEALGKKFLNMEYGEADKMSQIYKRFVSELYPSETFYTTLLPKEAQESIGQVNKQTLPVKSMLEKIGFEYTNEIDPFDGGPHYRAKVNKIIPIKNIIRGKIFYVKNLSNKKPGIIKFQHKDFPFYSIICYFQYDSRKKLILVKKNSYLKPEMSVEALIL